ncbi:MAG: Spermidine/putrescine transport system permease protein PotB [Chlamydiia bacterium]|nr:Spermidine/putrescine transport system permease protein PotB [Chlamydiia bacterium]
MGISILAKAPSFLRKKNRTEKQATKSVVKTELPFAIGVPALIWQILFFYLPLSIMLVSSIVHVSADGQILGLTFSNFTPVLKPAYFSIIASSGMLALTTSLSCLLIAFPLAYFIAFKAKRYKTIFLFLLIVPFWTNFLLHIYAWFFVLEKEGFLNHLLLSLGIIGSPIHFLNTPFAVYIMMVYYYLPFMVLPIYSSLERFDRTLLEASLDLGANWQQTIWKILLPMSMNGIQAGIFLVFIPAFGEFVIPELMGGDKHYYVGSVISQFILGDNTGPIGTAFTVLSASALALMVVALFTGLNVCRRLLIGRVR